jgi:hypothetical protein
MNGTDLVRLNVDEMARVSKALAQSQRFGQLSIEAAFVSVLAGQELGIPPFAAITGIHVIQGKPVLGAGILAGLVKASPKYDYRVTKHDDNECVIAFFESGDHVGDSSFSMSDAKRAGLTKNPTWGNYPRNMLFARAMSNGVAWFCADLTAGRVYVEGEIEEPPPPPVREFVATVEAESVPEAVERGAEDTELHERESFPGGLPDVQNAKAERKRRSPIEKRDADDAKAQREADELFGEAHAAVASIPQYGDGAPA